MISFTHSKTSLFLNKLSLLHIPTLAFTALHPQPLPKSKLWNNVILSLCRKGQLKEAMKIISREKDMITLDLDSYYSLLHLCASTKSLTEGMILHSRMLLEGFEFDSRNLGDRLVYMYARCQRPEDARQVLDEMPEPKTVFSWNMVIRACAASGMCENAVDLYDEMRSLGVKPDKFTFPCVLKACAGLSGPHRDIHGTGALERGKDVHDYARKLGFELDLYVGNALVAMYAKCGNVEDARQVFDKMPQRDVVSWTSIIGGYVQKGYCKEALELFREMESIEVQPDQFTFASVLRACGVLADLEKGREVHDEIRRRGFQNDKVVGNALVTMYANCGCIEDACQGFDKLSQRDVASWNAVITAYAQHGIFDKVLRYFQKMKMEGMIPNVVTWSAMIAGYAQKGCGNEALKVFREMLFAGVRPNSITIASILQSCARLATLKLGKEIHDYIIRSELGFDVLVGNALIDMYAKCGNINYARCLFDRVDKRDVITWNAIIAGVAMNGHGDDALRLFHSMQKGDIKPDDTTFIAVLSGCSHAGFVEDGLKCFESMDRDFGIKPRVEHYACIVDLLGRSGHLSEAENFIKNMPLEPNVEVWGALLAASRIHCSVEIGERAAEHLFMLEPENIGYHVLLSNIYAAAGRWDGVLKMRTIINGKNLKKNPGCTWIEVNNKVYEFLVEDRSHPQEEESTMQL